MTPATAAAVDPREPWRTRFADATRGLAAPVVVACSGGADSVALLALAVDAALAPVAVHVDHGLREGSDHDAEHVRAVASTLGAGFRAVKVEIAPGSNLEARAREARYAVLDAVRVEVGAEVVLVGHTADDQAETVLLNVLRGAASAGLAGMAPRHGTVVRPLLDARRLQRGVPSVARTGFEIGTGFERDECCMEPRTERVGERAHVRDFGVAPCAQPVVDVHRHRREPGVDREGEQRDGVSTARARDHDR